MRHEVAPSVQTWLRACVLVAALSVTVFGAACGGEPRADDQALAEKAIIRLSDLRGEWTDETSGEGNSRCAMFDVPGLVVTGRAHSAFNLYAVGSVLSDAGVYQDSADEAFEKVVSHARNCSQEYVERLLDKPAELLRGITPRDLSPKERALLKAFSLAEPSVREISLPPLGDSSRAYGITVGHGPGAFGLGLRAPLSPVQIAVIRKGRSLALLFLSSIGGLSDDFLVELAETVASRM